jgi:hypothetical protein
MKNRCKLLLGVVFAACYVLALSGCDGRPTALRDFVQADKEGKPIKCADLLAANVADGATRGISSENVAPVALWMEQYGGYTFHQCHPEIDADRHSRCESYADGLSQSLTRSGYLWEGADLFRFDDWAAVCRTEIKAAVATVNDEFKVDLGGPNPIVDLHREGIALPVSGIQTLSMDSRYADDSLWDVQFVTAGGKYSLWYGSAKKATAAYDELRSAWRLAAPVPADHRA